MAKMGSGTGLRKIALSQIVDTGNVRVDYADIEELAESIKRTGQLEPVLVKALEPDADGIEKYELIAGHRRRMAFQKLCEAGESFTNIDALVITGDKLTIQLVENLQRSDLTAPEREKGIYGMCKAGLSQKEVAARLSKTPEFISRNVSAYKIREAAQSAGVDTSRLATGTLNEIQAAAAADYPYLVKEILQNGGTMEAARAVMEIYRIEHGKPANPQKEKRRGEPPPQSPEKESGGTLSDPLGLDPLAGSGFENGLPDSLLLHPSPVTDPLVEKLSDNAGAVDVKNGNTPSAKPAVRASPARAWKDEFDPPHRSIDFNNVCLVIFEYAEKNEAVVRACKVTTCEACKDRCAFFYNLEAAKDIIALLHAGL
jgi:ParB/RepB/Spo0J family partition protein